jgi:hypothetical protein
MILDPEDGNYTFLRNVGSCTDYTALYPKEQQLSLLPLLEPQILQVDLLINIPSVICIATSLVLQDVPTSCFGPLFFLYNQPVAGIALFFFYFIIKYIKLFRINLCPRSATVLTLANAQRDEILIFYFLCFGNKSKKK